MACPTGWGTGSILDRRQGREPPPRGLFCPSDVGGTTSLPATLSSTEMVRSTPQFRGPGWGRGRGWGVSSRSTGGRADTTDSSFWIETLSTEGLLGPNRMGCKVLSPPVPSSPSADCRLVGNWNHYKLSQHINTTLARAEISAPPAPPIALSPKQPKHFPEH